MTKSKEKKKTVAIYTRVSTDRQDTESQVVELREHVNRCEWDLFKEYSDNGFSGKNTERPAFMEMMKAARERRFNILMVWKMDRLSRSLKDLVVTIGELKDLGIDFVSVTNQIDTTTSTGRLLFQIIGAISEFEREIIRERVIIGLKNAVRKGKKLGRPPVSDATIRKARKMREKGLSFRQIAKELKLDHSTLVRKFKTAERKNGF